MAEQAELDSGDAADPKKLRLGVNLDSQHERSLEAAVATMAAAGAAVTVMEVTEAVSPELQLAVAPAVVTALTVLEITSRVAAALSERAEAQLPQRGSAAAVAEFPVGVPAAVTTAVAAAAAPLGAPSYWGQMSRKLRKNWMNRNKRV